MKKLLVFVLVLAFMPLTFSAEQYAKPMIDAGAKPSDLLQVAFDSAAGTWTDEIVACLDSVSRFRMHTVSVPFGLSVTANDTDWYFIYAVPGGMTATIRGLYVTCETEPDDNGNTNGKFGFVVYDSSAADTVKKLGTEVSADADSAYLVAGDLTAFSCDSITTLGAGDIIFMRTWADTANLVLDGGGVFLDIDLDE